MEKIGALLKSKRLEVGLTIEEVSAKTRLTTKHIRAIEEGDISYFRDDLSYLRYFLRSYCDVLGINFDDIKGELMTSIDDYTSTSLMNKVNEHEKIEENITQRAKIITKPKVKEHKKINKNDLSIVSLFAIVGVVIVALIFAFVTYVLPNIGKDKETTGGVPPQSTNTPKPEKDVNDKDKEENKDTKPTTNLMIKEIAPDTYEIENVVANSDLNIDITFESNSWFAMYLDNVTLNEPLSKVYNFQEKISYKTKAVLNQKIGIRFGYMANHKILVNGVEVKLNPTITSDINPTTITLVVKGAN
ncbi:MAG: helix-turn-helix domain-containing protein [Erysipelotrichaceae bacterium]